MGSPLIARYYGESERHHPSGAREGRVSRSARQGLRPGPQLPDQGGRRFLHRPPPLADGGNQEGYRRGGCRRFCPGRGDGATLSEVDPMKVVWLREALVALDLEYDYLAQRNLRAAKRVFDR